MIYIKAMDKNKILLDFLEKYKSLPEQRSAEWIDQRKLIIGGSEMSVITGDNPWKKIHNLIESHVGLIEFNGNINTYWGTILEDLVVKILQTEWNCKIYETGSLPGVIPNQRYSPDGLVYLSFLDKILLLEIKCAARRIAGGVVPKTYRPQIYTGLDAVRIADMGLFVDAMFRRCSIEDFGFNNRYDKQIHPDKKTKDPIALAVIVLKTNKLSDPIDAGSCESAILEQLLKDAIEEKYTIEYYYTKYDTDINKYIDEYTYAILPLKLFKLSLIPIDRYDWKTDDNKHYSSYTKVYEEKINETIDTIRTVSQQDDKYNALADLFPEHYPQYYIFSDDDSVVE